MRRKIPLEDFFKKPEKSRVQLSPSGKYLSWMEPFQRRLNVYVRDLVKGKTRQLTEATERDIYGYGWANNETLIYVTDKGGDENTLLYGINADGSNKHEYTPFENVKSSIVDILEDDDEHLLFKMNKRNSQVFDLYRLNVSSGEMEMVAENPGNISRWIPDHEGKIRLAATTDGVNEAIIYRESEKSSWKTVAQYDFRESASPLSFTYDNKAIYVCSNVGRDKSAIFEYDLNTGKEGKLIFEHLDVDVSRLLHSRKRKIITGVSYTTDKKAYYFFDEKREKIQLFIDEKLKGYENSIACFDRNETKCIVYSGSDRTLGAYYILNLEKFEIEKLFDLSPWLKEEELAEVKPIKFKARDGLIIHGYLTLPPGDNEKRLPMIINPHGGPWVRDVWRFNPETQFLANRGFAVLQINYRGSSGYGRKFWELGFKQWGLAMQDDITDAVKWAIDEGTADPKRVVIYGGSYGGYATLSGITKTPDLYAAAVDYVGVSNLFTFLETIPPYWEPYKEMMYEMVGHPEKEKEQFKETSPSLNADKIRTPLFIAQGANDPRVKKSESDQMVEALKSKGVDVEYMVKENEGHGFSNEENRFDFYKKMENFLNKHIKG